MELVLTYGLLCAALFFDLKERRIPNALTVGATVAGLALRPLFYGWTGLSTGFMGLGLGLVMLLPLFAFGKFGGGDVKLLAAVGALRGVHFIWRAALLGAVSGGALAVMLLAYHRELGLVAYGAVSRSYRSGRTYPYSPAIALGVLLADLGWII